MSRKPPYDRAGMRLRDETGKQDADATDGPASMTAPPRSAPIAGARVTSHDLQAGARRVRDALNARVAGQSAPHVYAAGCAGEPTGLLEALIGVGGLAEARVEGVWIPGVNGIDWSRVGPGARARTIFLSPALRESFEAGRVEFAPATYAQTWARLAQSAPDAAFVSVSPPGPDGACSLGVACDFTPAVWSAARLKIGLIRPDMPAPPSAPRLDGSDFDLLIDAEAPLLTAPDPELDPVFNAIGAHVADRIRSGDTLQLGLGKVQTAVLRALAEPGRDLLGLSLHAGMVSDSLLALLDGGLIERVTTGVALGSPALYEAVARDRRVRFAPVGETHAHATLSALPSLIAINSVIEVDLFGQANAEFLGGRQISGGGGLLDFIRGAHASPGGAPILALASTAKGGTISRITPRLAHGAASVGRADAGLVATEHGMADLRGLDIDARAHALIGVAAPGHRDALAVAWDEMRRRM